MRKLFFLLFATIGEELAGTRRRIVVEGLLTALLGVFLVCASGFGLALLAIAAIKAFGTMVALGLFVAGFLMLALFALGGLWLARRRARRRALLLRMQRQEVIRYAELHAIGVAAEAAGFVRGFAATLARGGRRI
ncbi:hypothetical protein [Acidimangrovimonas sediminis]|uniref:hypothetical protein n=1 Tax=Acidimangrovimonas sediminis TaxID=2056283 RepID=UPI000C7FDB04|nr:hypothetical protein [Acidimangrovimonas sediminis]